MEESDTGINGTNDRMDDEEYESDVDVKYDRTKAARHYFNSSFCKPDFGNTNGYDYGEKIEIIIQYKKKQ